jgi:hypothetical protein
VISYAHARISAKGNPSAASTITSDVVYLGRFSSGVTVAAT